MGATAAIVFTALLIKGTLIGAIVMQRRRIQILHAVLLARSVHAMNARVTAFAAR